MNSSDFGNIDSGFSNSNEPSSNFGFDSRSAFLGSSSGGLSKRKHFKMRKQMGSQHPRSIPVRESTRGDLGFNPFQPVVFKGFDSVLSGMGSVSSVSGESRESGNDAFVFRANRVDSSSMDKELLDELRKLRISSGNPNHSNANDGVCNLNTGDRISNKANVIKNDDRGSFCFGGSKVSNVLDEMRKLNIQGSKKAKDLDFKFSANDKNKFSSGSGVSDTSSLGRSFGYELPNELKKLNIRGSDGRVSDNATTSNARNKGEFIFGSKHKGNDSSVAEILSAKLPNQKKNSNIKGSVVTNDYRSGTDCFSERIENILSNEMNRLRIIRNTRDSAGQSDLRTSTFQVFVNETEPLNLGKIGSQVPVGKPTNVTELKGTAKFSDGQFHPDVDDSEAPSTDRPIFNHEFSFSNKQDGLKAPDIQFRIPNLKASGCNNCVEFSATRGGSKDARFKKKRGKLRQVNPFHLQPGKDSVPKETMSRSNVESSESYSPMDVSPYQETLADKQFSREASVTKDKSHDFDNNETSSDTLPVSGEAIDEDLVAATKQLNIDGGSETKYSETKGVSCDYRSNKEISRDCTVEESLSGAETESFKSANEQLDTNSDATSTSAESDIGSNSKFERRDFDGRKQFSFASSSEDIRSSNFTFAACCSTQAQLSAATRQYKKKSRTKIGYGSSNSTSESKDPCASSSEQFFSLSGTPSLLPPSKGLKVDLSTSQGRGEIKTALNDKQEIEHESVSASAMAQEACEKWRLRGNQAYSNGDLSKAEDCYTQGLDCVSQNKIPKSCLRALMLCYSNRAATRMSLGRIREALADCMLAAAIDPNFLRVQVRAADCCLALGEVEDAARHFKKCLQSGSDVCVDRKIAVEASEGLQKAQKVSNCLSRSAELLQHRTSNDAEIALGVIADGLSVSLYSEKLLELKAVALLMLQKYEEVIQLCKQTLDSAEKNSPLRGADGNSVSVDGSGFPRHSSLRLWRLCLSFKSYFYLGKLEEALEIVEKQEGSGIECKALESAIPLVVTVRELLRHKVSGNQAFQSGRHAEAAEHYTAALTCNVESRPFAAICFCNRAAAHKALGQITDAIADCSLAISFDGNYSKAISRRATLFEMIRDYEQAAADLQKLLSLLSKQGEEKGNLSGAPAKSATCANDLREVQLHLSTVEEEARKEIPLDLYLILGIEPSASATDIKKAYRKAALRHHPDKAVQYLARGENGDDRIWKEVDEEVHKDADRLFKMIGEAYAVLSDPTKRGRYDLEVEIRNAQKKGNQSNTSRMRTDVPNYHFEQNNNRRNWRDIKKSYWSSRSQGSEASRSNKYY